MQVQISGNSTAFCLDVHKHRFAAYLAGRGASIRTAPFSVAKGKDILERIGLDHDFAHSDQLPSWSEVDVVHRRWHRKAIRVAERDWGLPFTHGIAAKLINIDCKSRSVCGGFHKHPSVKALHPPIDSVLLDTLFACEDERMAVERTVWREARKKCWSKFDSEDYEQLIQAFRRVLARKPLWMIEEYWPGAGYRRRPSSMRCHR